MIIINNTRNYSHETVCIFADWQDNSTIVVYNWYFVKIAQRGPLTNL